MSAGPVESPRADSVHRIGVALKAYLALTLVLTSLWTQLGQIGWMVCPLFGLTLLLDLRPQWFLPVEADRASGAALPFDDLARRWLPAGLTWRAVAIGGGICLPVFVHLFLTRHEEFPFASDEGYVLSATRAYALLLRQALPIAAGLAVLVFVVFRKLTARASLTVFVAGLYAASYWFPPHEFVGRYPATFYFLATPLNVLSTAARWRSPFQANHIVNALSVPVWLFLLRPALVRRWPDWTILPLGVFLFYQKEVVYYFAGGLLEPWALIFLLLAFEALMVLPADGAWIACLLAGWSFMIKEPGVLLFPAVWLLSMRWRVTAEVRLRQFALGAAALAPFLIYYVVRYRVARRPVGLDFGPDILNLDSLGLWWHRVAAEFGASGIVALAALIAYAAVGLWTLRDDWRAWRVHAALSAATLGLLAYFFVFVDAVSEHYIGYSRFMLYPLFLAALLTVPWALRLANGVPAAIAGIVILALQIVPLGRALALDLRPDYARNSVEWIRIPIFYPVRTLLEQMERRPGAEAVQAIRVVTPGVDPIVAAVVYPDFRRRFSIRPESWTTVSGSCECSAGLAAFVGFQFRTGMALDEPDDGSMRTVTTMCVQQLHSTCSEVLEARHDTGDLVGVLGIPRR